mgnify:FL=1
MIYSTCASFSHINKIKIPLNSYLRTNDISNNKVNSILFFYDLCHVDSSIMLITMLLRIDRMRP